MGIEAVVGAIAAAVSIGTGIASAVNKPDEPKVPKPGQSPAAIAQQRQQRAAASGRTGTILTSQKLGSVGGSSPT